MFCQSYCFASAGAQSCSSVRKSTRDEVTRKSGEPCAAFLSREEGNHSVLRHDRFIGCAEIHVQADSLCQHLSAHLSKTGTFTSSEVSGNWRTLFSQHIVMQQRFCHCALRTLLLLFEDTDL